MLEKYFVRPATVDRIRSSWISGAIEQYVKWLTENGYAARNMAHRVPLLRHFGEFARERGAKRLRDLPTHVEAFAEYWVKQRGQGLRTTRARKKLASDARNPVEQMLRLVVPGFVGRPRSRWQKDPFRGKCGAFFKYLHEERGLREASIKHYRHHLGPFEAYLARIGLRDLKSLSPAVIGAFLVECNRHLGRSSISGRCGVLRVFLRYLHRERLVRKDFSSCIQFPRKYRLSHLPRSIPWNDVRRMLEAVDRRSRTGKRDYAILLLLITYGLRAHEVAGLTLDHIDWKRDRLLVPERKAGHSTAYPLSATVGTALVDYLKHARPEASDRHVFFRVLAPPLPLQHAAISSRAAHYLRKAGVVAPRLGSHTLRHTCVQRLVDANIPFKVIGDYVGHRTPDSTRIYAKVAVEALRQVALGDGEDLL